MSFDLNNLEKPKKEWLGFFLNSDFVFKEINMLTLILLFIYKKWTTLTKNGTASKSVFYLNGLNI